MSDLKYGRLFTEEDVDKLLNWLNPGGLESPTGEVIAQAEAEGVEFRFPADEPVMVFRAKDDCFPATLDFYHVECEVAEAPDEHIKTIGLQEDRVREWRAANSDKTGTPD